MESDVRKRYFIANDFYLLAVEVYNTQSIQMLSPFLNVVMKYPLRKYK